MSVLAGFAVAGVGLLTSSQMPLLPTGFRIEYLPHPREYVQIKEGTQYTVPAGKIFVLTALGDDGAATDVWLSVNGQRELRLLHAFAQNPPTVAPVATGFAVAAGGTIEVVVPSSSPLAGRAWGYRASQ